ncbi:DUF2842 domain-containing protein [Pseudemcibacter aquimaris]|uniref:DUF2842 domain-containing protein n=1 Tax=Pseudemcibacter aquimaris TaxID=2857064 RepID=UPI002010FE0C|nr:DUF2842 domain-containing protein [Pseudemcibacter aquimaris]MCC3861330.1 DUF2842 domain-containing protein [Pseudemcibacter aquimaris]WDU58102.1 DUF2842 domain-containing protein [Pseudemcibacter aquimaris]
MNENPPPKISKLLWLLLMLAVMTIYILLVARLIDALFAGNIIMELISYILAGIIWVFPAKKIMFIINRTDTDNGDQ